MDAVDEAAAKLLEKLIHSMPQRLYHKRIAGITRDPVAIKTIAIALRAAKVEGLEEMARYFQERYGIAVANKLRAEAERLKRDDNVRANT